MKRWSPPVAALLAAVALLLWWNAPARVIERRTRALLETISVPASSGKAARLVRPDSLTPFLAPVVSFQTPADDVNGELDRTEVVAGFRHVAAAATETRFDLVETRSVDVADDRAIIRFLLDAYTDLSGRDSANGRHEARLDWHKEDGNWRIVAVEVRPAGP